MEINRTLMSNPNIADQQETNLSYKDQSLTFLLREINRSRKNAVVLEEDQEVEEIKLNLILKENILLFFLLLLQITLTNSHKRWIFNKILKN